MYNLTPLKSAKSINSFVCLGNKVPGFSKNTLKLIIMQIYERKLLQINALVLSL